uniref:Uncharacterized protein n=1 Tax=Neobacillus citreus TaxID=2833578 RepID=A0A942SXI5_9BACI
MKCKQRKWAMSAAVVASVAAASIFGTAVPAQAAPASAWTSTVREVPMIQSAEGRPAIPAASGVGSPDRTSTGSGQADARSWSTIIRSAINALKKVPSIWKKVTDGVKKSYATFKSKVWPAIKATVGVVSTLITAWDIWKFFN